MKISSELWREGEAESPKSTCDALRSNATYSHSHTLKPLLDGCLTGQTHALIRHGACVVKAVGPKLHNAPDFYKRLYSIHMANIKQLRLDLLCGTTYTTATIGLFEVLTNKLRTRNNGMPLSLYQEACCGLTCGAAAAFIWKPFHLASSQTTGQSYRHLFSTLSHIVGDKGVLALWKGSGSYVGRQMATNMGMLSSYNRSLTYLNESQGLPMESAQLSASIISGFFFAACGQSFDLLKAIINAVERNNAASRRIPSRIFWLLIPYSGSQFYVRFFKQFGQLAQFFMIEWSIYECFRTTEKSVELLPQKRSESISTTAPIEDFLDRVEKQH